MRILVTLSPKRSEANTGTLPTSVGQYRRSSDMGQKTTLSDEALQYFNQAHLYFLGLTHSGLARLDPSGLVLVHLE